MYFFSFVAAGAVFLALAFMLFLPIIIVAPSKFALSFTVGCMLIMAGFGQLRGWKQQLSHMMSQERLPVSAGVFKCGAAASPQLLGSLQHSLECQAAAVMRHLMGPLWWW
jgi:hypothetical protein